MGDYKIAVDQSKKENGTAETLLYRNKYVPTRWPIRQSNTSWSWNPLRRSSMETVTDSSDDDDCTAPIKPKQIGRYYRIAATVAFFLCLAAYVATTAPLLMKDIEAKREASRRYTCGSSREEAIALDCTFDPVTVQWLPQQCSRAGLEEFLTAHTWHHQSSLRSISQREREADHESNITYPDQNPDEGYWRYYTDETQTVEYPNGLVDAPVGVHTYWTTRGEHLAHCTFMLIRGFEVRRAGERVDTFTDEFEHSVHCARLLFYYARNAPHFNSVNTPGNVKLGSCWDSDGD